MLEAGTMLSVYRREFETIMRIKNDKDRTRLLANLMTKMEKWYQLSMIKELFERETDPGVKELYLAISNARRF